MANPTESMPTDSDLNALAETTDGETGFAYLQIGEAPCYTTELGEQWKLNRIAALAGALRVVKDGSLTFGVFSGSFVHAGAAVNYTGSSGNALTDNATNYAWLDTSGTLQTNTTGFPDAAHVPLATIVTVSGEYDHADIIDCRSRAMFAAVGQAELRSHRIDLLSARNADGTEPDGTTGNFAITSGGWGTGTLTLDGEAASGNTKTDTLMFEHVLAPGYVADADVKLVVSCRESVGAATVSTTISAEVYECDGNGGVSADLAGAWDDSDVTAAWADKGLTITDAGLSPGDKLRILVRIVTDDSGGAVGTVAQIGGIDVQYDEAVGV